MTKEEIEVMVRKVVQETVNDAIRNLNEYTDGLHGTSTNDITKLNAAVMDLSSDFYSEDTASDGTSEEGAN